MRILCLNFTHKTACALPAGLAAVGCEVETLTAPGRPDHLRFEATILATGRKFQPDFILAYGWWPDAVKYDRFAKVLKVLKTPFLWWAYDDPFFFEEISLPMARLATHVFTPDADSISRYEQIGVPSSLLTFAADPACHCPTTPKYEFEHDIVLVANNYGVKGQDIWSFRWEGVRNALLPLVDAGYDVRVWGWWWQGQQQQFTLPDHVYQGVLPQHLVNQVYSSAKIVLGLQSVGNSSTFISMRTYEAMCCGAFYLTQYSPAHEHLFRKGIHLEWSRSASETVALVDYYLTHPQARRRIAQQGRQVVLRHHTYTHRAQAIVDQLHRRRSGVSHA